MCTCVCVCRRKLERNENEGKKIVSIQCLSTSIVKLHGRLTSIIDILSNSGILIYKYFLTKIFVEAMKKKKKDSKSNDKIPISFNGSINIFDFGFDSES